MTTNRLLTVLVILTAAMQVAILYRQPRPPAPLPPTAGAPAGVYFDLVDFPVRGKPNATGVVVEFSDYECPFCARHATGVLPELMVSFVDAGIIRYALANNPLRMHPNAKWLASVAMCAGKQGLYWEMHDRLFLSKPASIDAAAALGQEVRVNSRSLTHCLDVDKAEHDRIIQRDQALAQRLGLVGTPAFAVGRIEGGGRVHVRKLIRGAAPIEVFRDVLDEVLSERREQRG